MRRSRFAASALALAAGTVAILGPALPAAHGAEGAWRDRPGRVECPNAAVNYLHAADAIRASGKSDELRMIDWHALEGIIDWDELPRDVREAAEAVPAQAIQAFLSGSRIECCQFYIAQSEGVNTLLPHLAPMRQVARVVRLDARAQLARGNTEAAAERLAGLYRMSMHLSNDAILISNLVGVAIAAFANSETTVLLESGRATPEVRRILAEALDRMDDDPFRLRATIQGEREWIFGWVRREFRGEDAGARLVQELGSAWGATAAPDLFRHGLETLDEAGLHREIDRIERYYDQVEQLWDAPNALERIEELDKRVRQGEFGFLGALAPSFDRVRAAADRAEADLARVLELLHGEKEDR